MRINSELSDGAIQRELGARLAATRLDLNITQAELAHNAGVSKRTVERLESGEVAAQLSVFLRVCRALGLLDRLEVLLPAPKASPITLLKLQGRQRQRAAPLKVAESKTWTWGESS